MKDHFPVCLALVVGLVSVCVTGQVAGKTVLSVWWSYQVMRLNARTISDARRSTTSKDPWGQ